MHILASSVNDMMLVFNVFGGTHNHIVITWANMPFTSAMDSVSYRSDAVVTAAALAPPAAGFSMIFLSCKTANDLVIARISPYSPKIVDFVMNVQARSIFSSKLLLMNTNFYLFAASTSFGPESNSIAVFKFSEHIVPSAET